MKNVPAREVDFITPAFDFCDNFNTLYKYRTFNDQALSVLIDKEIFCAAPENLNDPFDSQFDVRKSLRSALKAIIAEDPKWPVSYQEAIGMLESGSATTMIDRALNSGICSFSTIPDNTLMWSHYADQHKGFCIGFNPRRLKADDGVSDFPHNVSPRAVTYTTRNPMSLATAMINRSAYAGSGPNGPLEQPLSGSIIRLACDAALSTKHLAWAYESEVRLIHYDGQNAVKVASNSIIEIIFGCRMPERNRMTLRNLVLSGDLNNVKFYELVKSETDLSFAVVECDPSTRITS